MKLLPLLLLLLIPGCAYLSSVTTSYDPDTGDATARTRVRVYTLFDSKSQLARFRNSTGAVGTNGFVLAPGTSIGGLIEDASSSNLVNILGAVAAGVTRGAVLGAREAQQPQPNQR